MPTKHKQIERFGNSCKQTSVVLLDQFAVARGYEVQFGVTILDIADATTQSTWSEFHADSKQYWYSFPTTTSKDGSMTVEIELRSYLNNFASDYEKPQNSSALHQMLDMLYCCLSQYATSNNIKCKIYARQTPKTSIVYKHLMLMGAEEQKGNATFCTLDCSYAPQNQAIMCTRIGNGGSLVVRNVGMFGRELFTLVGKYIGIKPSHRVDLVSSEADDVSGALAGDEVDTLWWNRERYTIVGSAAIEEFTPKARREYASSQSSSGGISASEWLAWVITNSFTGFLLCVQSDAEEVEGNED